MPSIRFKHLPSQQTFLVDPENARVYGVAAAVSGITQRDRLGEDGIGAGVRADDLLATARDFLRLWKWPAPGTRFPPADLERAFPDAWFGALEGRLNRTGPKGDLEFRGFLDREEQRRFDSGAAVAAERSALERHLCALDYQLEGKLGLRALYRAFIANRLSKAESMKKAVGALLVFGRGRPVDIATIGARRPSARTRAFDEHGNVDPEIIGQYRRLFDGTSADEIDQERLARFNARSFQGGLVSNQQWQTFFATCTALNHRKTVTFRQLLGMFEGDLEYVAASRAGADGRRPLDRVLPD